MLAVIGSAILWYCFLLLIFLVFNKITDSILIESPDIFYLVLSIGGLIMPFIAATLGVPFVVWALKKLKVQSPVVSSIALFSAFIFAYTLAGFLTALTSGHAYSSFNVIVTTLASLISSSLLYGLAIRPLKRKVSNAWFLTICIGIALLPVVLYFAYGYLAPLIRS